MRARHPSKALLLASLIWLCGASIARAEDQTCAVHVAIVEAAQGRVETAPSGAEFWQRTAPGDRLCPGHSVRTGRDGKATIRLIREQTLVRLNTSANVTFRERQTARTLLEVIWGATFIFSRTPRQLDVHTPHINGGIEGTEFLVQVDKQNNRSFIQVFEGTVSAENAQSDGIIYAAQGDTITADDTSAPRKLSRDRPADVILWRGLVDPLEEVQWTLYYPIVSTVPTDLQAAIQAGNLKQARTLVSAHSQSADIQALGILIDVVQSRSAEDRAANLAAAEKATEQFPSSETVALTLTYALQSLGRVEEAFASANRFAQQKSATSLMTLRRAELALINHKAVLAQTLASSVRSDPTTSSRAHTILGFMSLQKLALNDAAQLFRTAIDLDSHDPAARFGLGLTKVRQGDLTEGRDHIELAVTLDPNVSLYRSYLGRAYFEERRSDKALSQYNLAKERDPADPTPWFYEAIQLFLENQPIQALRSLTESIARNDNRAVYRTRRALSDDMAVRGSVLSGIYRTLGLEELGMPEASRAITSAPADHVGYRFHGDLLADQPFQDFARASSIRKAQILQPSTLDPVRPQLAETDLAFLGGAGFNGISFNEYTTAFEANGHKLTVAGLAGNYGTAANEFILSGLQGKIGYNISQFHYETDGVRDNNDVRHDILSAFVQGEVTPRIRLQAEFRYRNTDQGDLSLNFDPDDFSRINRTKIESFSGRIGGRFDLTASNTLIANVEYRDFDSEVFVESPVSRASVDSDIDGYAFQTQNIFDHRFFSIVSGIEFSQDEVKFASRIDTTPLFGGSCPAFLASCVTNAQFSNDRRKFSVYGYAYVKLNPKTTFTIGIAHDDLNPSTNGFDQLQPKFGIMHRLTDKLNVRFAYTQGAGTNPDTPLSLQPTQIAGFPQFFDDGVSSTNEHAAAAVDYIASNLVSGQIRAIWRESDLRIPNLSLTSSALADFELLEISSLLNILPSTSTQVSINASFNKVQLGGAFFSPIAANVPEAIETLMLPVTARYFAPWGTKIEAKATFVHQDLSTTPFSTLTTTSEDFVTFDMHVSHRFRTGTGEVSVGIKNIFGADFRYQDLNTLLGDAANPSFVNATTFTVAGTIRF